MQCFRECLKLFLVDHNPRTAIFGRPALVGVVLREPNLQICRRSGVELTRRKAAKDVNRRHGRDSNSRPNAPEGRRGDLYPAELRAHSDRISYFAPNCGSGAG
jgi:hypothetical protein